MRVLVWLVEDTWEATIAQARVLLPEDVEITLLHVSPVEAEDVLHGVRAGLLGRHPHPPPDEPAAVKAISEEAAARLLSAAQAQMGRPSRTLSRRGRVEREVIAAADGHDLLVLARDGDHAHLGPRSLGHQARFVVDHAGCQVLLVWPD